MTQTVIGIFNGEDDAKNAVQKLRSNGFLDANVDASNESILRGDSTNDRNEDDSLGDRIERFFKNLFDDDEESTKYTAAARKGYVVNVQANTEEEALLASRILDETGAIDVDNDTALDTSERSASADIEGRSSFFDTDDRTAGDDTTRTSIPVVEEELNVGKREVETGHVRVRSRIIERPVEQTLRLREERVNVERTPTDRPATESDFATSQDEIEIRTTAEIPVVQKEARVVEEVRLKKDVREREQVVKDKVRRKDVEVDDDSTTDLDDVNRRV